MHKIGETSPVPVELDPAREVRGAEIKKDTPVPLSAEIVAMLSIMEKAEKGEGYTREIKEDGSALFYKVEQDKGDAQSEKSLTLFMDAQWYEALISLHEKILKSSTENPEERQRIIDRAMKQGVFVKPPDGSYEWDVKQKRPDVNRPIVSGQGVPHEKTSH